MDIEEIRKLKVNIRDRGALERISINKLKMFVETVGGWKHQSSFQNFEIYQHLGARSIESLIDDPEEGHFQILIPKHNKFDDYALRMHEALTVLEKTDPESRTQIQILEEIIREGK